MHVPQPGDIYAFTRPTITRAGKTYEAGDTLVLLEQTDEDPWGNRSHICSWRVKCRHFEPPAVESIWPTIWTMIEERKISWTGTNIHDDIAWSIDDAVARIKGS